MLLLASGVDGLPAVQLVGQSLSSLESRFLVPSVLRVDELGLAIHVKVAENLGSFGQHAELEIKLRFAEGLIANLQGIVIRVLVKVDFAEYMLKHLLIVLRALLGQLPGHLLESIVEHRTLAVHGEVVVRHLIHLGLLEDLRQDLVGVFLSLCAILLH